MTTKSMPAIESRREASHRFAVNATFILMAAIAVSWVGHARANEPPAKAAPVAAPVSPKEVGDQVRQALDTGDAKTKKLTLVVTGKEKSLITMPAAAPAASALAAAAGQHGGESGAAAMPALAEAKKSAPAQGQYALARAVAHGQAPNSVSKARMAKMTTVAATGAHTGQAAQTGHDVHWDYEGSNGPQAWGSLKPDFNTCAVGKRQSPIHIEDRDTLQGPAEVLGLLYNPSSATVVNNGHTIQVDVNGDNTIVVRGSSYKLLQFHFHHPSEERVNFKSFAMVAHLVHKNADGQLAVVAVLLEPGQANALINKVWTFMPLDANDRVRMPPGVLDMNELLPDDKRYYQFMGSLTTPPCSEGVLWMVLKKPVQISPAQLKLFGQLFPNNARPVQPVNGRAIRDAQ